MEHAEMVNLLRAGVPHTGGIWAELGAGTGNFTRALAALLGPQATLYAVDRDLRAVQRLEVLAKELPLQLLPQQADITQRLSFPALDGVLMANVLHFIRDQAALLTRIRGWVRPGGRLLLVEYDQQQPISWVPFPLPPARFVALAQGAGFATVEMVGQRHSRSGGPDMYAAVAS